VTKLTPTPQPKRWNWSAITSLITTGTALGALVFTGLSLNATKQGQITDRYSKAVEQIGTQGSDHLETRLGGIYALERLTKDSPRDQPTIIEVLSAFIRGNAPLADHAPCSADPVGLDVQAALTVLGRRDPTEDQKTRIDLSHSCLPNVNLQGANLISGHLVNTNVRHANLRTANLTYADLFGANLIGANLIGANLTGANLTDVNLTDVNLTGADLTGADLTGANLTGTKHDVTTKTNGAKRNGAVRAWW